MKIAITSQDLSTVTPHAGRARSFLVFEADPGGEPRALPPIELPAELTVHAWHGSGAHPLDAVDVVIAGSFGAHFAARMAARGIVAVRTELTDPDAAVREHLAHVVAGTVPAAVARAAGGCGCDGHDHDHH